MTDPSKNFAIEKPAQVLYLIAKDALQVVETRPGAAVVVIAFSMIWLEAYFNQIVELLHFYRQIRPMPTSVQHAIDEQVALEQNRTQLIQKIESFAACLTNGEQDRGSKIYQDLVLLQKLRDLLVHCWPTRVSAGPAGEPLVLSQSRSRTVNIDAIILELVARGVLDRDYAYGKPLLLEAISRGETARWAFDTAQATARFIANCFPDDAMRLWANRENPGSGVLPPRYYVGSTGLPIRLPDGFSLV